MTDDPFALDIRNLHKALNRRVLQQKDNVLVSTLAGQLVNKLSCIRMPPHTILTAGAASSESTRLLEKTYKTAKIVVADMADRQLVQLYKKAGWFSRQRFVCADTLHLPVRTQNFDLVFSHFALHWYAQVQNVLEEWRRVLKPNGVLFFSALGMNSLREIAESWAMLDERYVHVNRFIDMRQLGDALLRAGFAEPVVEVERYQLVYDSGLALLADLRSMGIGNLNPGRMRGLLGRRKFQMFVKQLESLRNAQGKLPLTFEVIFAHAFVPERQSSRREAGMGDIVIPVTSLKRPSKR